LIISFHAFIVKVEFTIDKPNVKIVNLFKVISLENRITFYAISIGKLFGEFDKEKKKWNPIKTI
jgi:hypothetical protein